MEAHLRDLRYFTVLAEELNFTRAAERLFITQPALSKQIRQLEQQLRTTLIVRDKRGIGLTAAGEALLPQARALLEQWSEAQRIVGEAAAAEESVLTVGMSTSVGRGMLSAAREAFTRHRPTWRTRMRQVNWDDPTAGLGSREVDVAFVWLPFPGHDSFDVHVLAREPRWVAFSPGHWLAARESVEFTELLDEPFIAMPESAGSLRDHWLAVAERGGRPVRIGATVWNAEETFAAVEEGSGIVLVSEGNAEIYRRPGIGVIPVTGIDPAVMAIAWRKHDRRAVIRDFVEAAASAAGG
ncbi:LysR family transcriptional regulator [Nocardia pneumoniae]|uniref:LysR family transcriptional regulator n=1 Tax=Nocardia pneumoniae TaxID=228601 RepID=UPI000592B3AA|nr:LysR family transcriptional regulator [Nocardia pneumoniae]